MFSSVQAGIRYARGAGAGGVLLFPADVPLVSPDTIRTVLKAAAGSDAPFAVPVYQGKNGHPLFIPSGYFDEILTYDGEGGLKGVRSRYDEGLLRVPVTDRGCVMDMDTPEDYKRLIQLFYDSSLRIILIRHGQPAQQRGKIFLGQTDIPLSDMGREEAKAAADTLIRLGVRPGRIYASDLARARETAEIIAARIGGVHVEEDKLFREMDMGSWDGEFIDEVKEKFPEEYAKRGEDIKSYRIPGGENFYDLRGRVSREFFRIWTGEFLPGARGGCSRDLVIVSHLGVIHSLATELLQDDHIPRDYPTGSVTVMDVPDWLRPEESK
jgi:probable phosphoglycerate mutase